MTKQVTAEMLLLTAYGCNAAMLINSTLLCWPRKYGAKSGANSVRLAPWPLKHGSP